MTDNPHQITRRDLIKGSTAAVGAFATKDLLRLADTLQNESFSRIFDRKFLDEAEHKNFIGVTYADQASFKTIVQPSNFENLDQLAQISGLNIQDLQKSQITWIAERYNLSEDIPSSHNWTEIPKPNYLKRELALFELDDGQKHIVYSSANGRVINQNISELMNEGANILEVTVCKNGALLITSQELDGLYEIALKFDGNGYSEYSRQDLTIRINIPSNKTLISHSEKVNKKRLEGLMITNDFQLLKYEFRRGGLDVQIVSEEKTNKTFLDDIDVLVRSSDKYYKDRPLLFTFGNIMAYISKSKNVSDNPNEGITLTILEKDKKVIKSLYSPRRKFDSVKMANTFTPVSDCELIKNQRYSNPEYGLPLGTISFEYSQEQLQAYILLFNRNKNLLVYEDADMLDMVRDHYEPRELPRGIPPTYSA